MRSASVVSVCGNTLQLFLVFSPNTNLFWRPWGASVILPHVLHFTPHSVVVTVSQWPRLGTFLCSISSCWFYDTKPIRRQFHENLLKMTSPHQQTLCCAENNLPLCAMSWLCHCCFHTSCRSFGANLEDRIESQWVRNNSALLPPTNCAFCSLSR